MPVEIDGKTFADHKSAVEHLKKSKPEISDPDAYVATVERKMKGAQLKNRLQKLSKGEKCPNCGKENQTGLLRCPYCGSSFNAKLAQQKLAYGKVCEMCGMHFETREEQEKHYEKDHPEVSGNRGATDEEQKKIEQRKKEKKIQEDMDKTGAKFQVSQLKARLQKLAEQKCAICGESKEKHGYGTHSFDPRPNK
jgi:hypothetical protein